MTQFLLDANRSPETSEFLRTTFGLDVLDLVSLGLTHFDDPEVVGRFFADPATAAIPLERSLVVIDEARVRVTTRP